MWEWGECRVSSDELMHYGVKGQKHGVRRYQNEDGTLTSEGKARYADMYDRDRGSGLIRSQIRSGQKYGAAGAFANHRMDRYKARIERHTDKFNKKIDKQKKALSDLDAYSKGHPKDSAKVKDIINEAKRGTKAKIGKLEAKRDAKIAKYKSKQEAQGAANANLEAYRRHSKTSHTALTSRAYQQARARGAGRLSAFVEGYGGLVGAGLRMHRNKKAYGKRIIWAEPVENDYNANAMDA